MSNEHRRLYHDCWSCPHLRARLGGACWCIRPGSWASNLKNRLLGYPPGPEVLDPPKIEDFPGPLKGKGARQAPLAARLQPRGDCPSPPWGGVALGAILIGLILLGLSL